MTGAAPSPEIVALLRALIGFDTVSERSNRALIDWAASAFEAAGATVLRDEAADGIHVNLLASWGGGPGGLVLSGHTDVVPVDGQHWSSPPFEAAIRDGRVHGRGACDMKGFVAVAMACAMRHGIAADAEMPPLHVALTYDEERGCLGIPHLLAAMDRAGIRPQACLVGEPTMMQVVCAHKEGRIYRCRVRGSAMHSSLAPRGVNAIEYAARLIAFIADLGQQAQRNGPHDDAYDIACSTISVNLVDGGNGANILPADCGFVFEYRMLPQCDAETFIARIREHADMLRGRMQQIDARADIVFEPLSAIPALDVPPDALIHRRALQSTGHNTAHKVAYGTEAGFFQAAGIETVVCGPGSIEQAHGPDEFVSLAQLADCERMVDRLIARYCREGS